MGKISPISNKYIIYAKIHVEGVVERPDVIGAIFGQTEGLLGSDLELRELQRSGRIARIDVNLTVKQGKTDGEIIIPSSLDKTETAIVAASIETITKIGPCDSKIEVEKIEDVRVSKRNFLMERAKGLLKDLNQKVLPDSGELATKVSEGVKAVGIVNYGKDRLPAGPDIDKSDEIILVEGRADVIVLLKNGFNNVIGVGGTSIPDTIKELCKKKTVTVLVDGDRGGDLIIKELANTTKIDFISKAPDGKEVEELTQKEIHKILRGKIPYGEKREIKSRTPIRTPIRRERKYSRTEERRPIRRKPRVPVNEKSKFKEMLDELVGTKGAFILNKELSILGKVPIKELVSTVKSLKTGMYAIILDGTIDRDIAYVSERNKIKYLVGNKSEVSRSRVIILTSEDL